MHEIVDPVDVIFEERGNAESPEHAVVDRSMWEVESIARHFVS